jgi:membrane protease subunit HflC
MAVASLILGMTFVIPLVPAILAVVAGLMARRSIESSQGSLLGKGAATIGLTLGSLQGAAWALILFAGMVYVVDPTETAVLVRNNEPAAIVRPGLNFKMPFFESVVFYPTSRIFENKTKPMSVLFLSNKRSDIIVTMGWRICDPMRFFKVSGKEFSASGPARRLTILAERYLRRADHKANDVDEFTSEFEYRYQMSESINEGAERFGLCVQYLKIEKAIENLQ